jgi:hypothetical protein
VAPDRALNRLTKPAAAAIGRFPRAKRVFFFVETDSERIYVANTFATG